ITGNIYITSLSGASNAMSVARENITHVLSLTVSKPHLPSLPPPAADPIHYHIPLENTPNSPLLERLPEVTMLIYEALHDPDIDSPKMLVHCDFGMSRAPAVVIGYLMATGGLSFREGIRMVQEKRGNVCLNLGF
ncbi:phosphatases II, partial [Ascodesmis nigricans]